MKTRYKIFFLLSTAALFADESLNEMASQSSEPTGIFHKTASTDEAIPYVAALKKSQSSNSASNKMQTSEQPPACEFSERIQVGGNYSYAWIKPKRNHTTKGSLGGARAIYEHRPQDAIYAAAAFSWRAGTTENKTTKRKLQDYNAQELVGYTFGKKRIGNNRLTLFTGVGVRYLAEKVHVHSAFLELDYTEFYIPVGFLFENKVNSVFSWGCNFEWMPQVFPIVRLQPLSGARWDLTYKISNFFVEVPFTFSFCSNRFSIVVSPFFESWHDGRSTAKTTNGLHLDLPSNTYLFTGVNVNFGISF